MSPFVKSRMRGGLLEQQTANNSPSLDFKSCITNACRSYLVVIDSLIPTANATQALFRMSSNGGATFDATSGNYSWVDYRIGPGGAAAGGSAASQTSLNITGGGNVEALKNTAIDGGLNGWFVLYNPLNTTGVKSITGETIFQSSNTTTLVLGVIGGRCSPATPLPHNAFTILPSSGSWASGVVSVYRMAKL